VKIRQALQPLRIAGFCFMFICLGMRSLFPNQLPPTNTSALLKFV
jgi:hypothetical protein